MKCASPYCVSPDTCPVQPPCTRKCVSNGALVMNSSVECYKLNLLCFPTDLHHPNCETYWQILWSLATYLQVKACTFNRHSCKNHVLMGVHHHQHCHNLFLLLDFFPGLFAGLCVLVPCGVKLKGHLLELHPTPPPTQMVIRRKVWFFI